MALLANLLCLATSLGAAVLLTRSYRASAARLILWSAACFWGLSIANLLTIVDLYAAPQQDLYWLRLASTFVSAALLLYGLVWDSR